MDAQGREESLSRRTSIKRPWDDTTLPEDLNGRHSVVLPPIDAVPYRRPSIPQGVEFGLLSDSPDPRESVVKKPKFERYDYNSIPRQISNIGQTPPFRLSNVEFSQHTGSIESPIFPSKQRLVAEGPAESQDTSTLCSRCRKLATHDEELDMYGVPDTCESCRRNPELAWVTEAAASALTRLAETLRSGISSEQRGIIRGPEQRNLGPVDCPPIAHSGLKQTLTWLLGRINQCSYMVDDLVRHVPAGTLQNLNKDIPQDGSTSPDDPPNIMKRRIDVDSDDSFKSRAEAIESTSDAKPYTRRRSVTAAPLVIEGFPPMMQHSDYHPSLHSSDSQAPGVSIMNPPPPPNRQLPSPPGRSLLSPTSINFPSPTAPPYGNAPQGFNLPLPTSLHQSTINNYLPPIAASHSPDSALRDHSAVLQHEVSIQKIALSSLQGEHDKLLAAFSRSKTRASALERKHAVSDNEVISLSEEKLRLQAQVIELERDVNELSRSRDESRQAAVQEGSQYIEIVKKASRLEEMAAKERRTWLNLKGDMEQRIEALSGGKGRHNENTGTTSDTNITPARRIMDDMDTDTPGSSTDMSTDLKIEHNEPLPTGPTSHPSITQQESAEELNDEIRRLRERCAEVENALRSMRDDSRSMDSLIKALVDRADSALKD